MSKSQTHSGGKARTPAIDELLGGWDAGAEHKSKKRSITIAGHRTSISLEEPFWNGLKAIALEKGVSVSALAAAIDTVRGETSLSSAIRLFVYARAAQGVSRTTRAAKAIKKSSTRR